MKKEKTNGNDVEKSDNKPVQELQFDTDKESLDQVTTDEEFIKINNEE